MPLPLIALGIGFAVSTAIGVGSSTYNFYQNSQRQAENQRYWNDYEKNTGIRPRYPYRTGSYYDYGYMLSYASDMSNVANRIAAKEIYG